MVEPVLNISWKYSFYDFVKIPQKFHAFSYYRVSTWSGKSEKVVEFVRGSGIVREIGDFLEKVREENFYPCNFLTLKKPVCT